MKRIILMLVLLVAASSVGLAQMQNKGGDKGMNSLTDAIVAHEKAVLDALMKKDRKAFDGLVASDGVLNGPQGRIPVAEFVKIAFSPDYTLSSATVEDPQVMMIDKDAAILTYKTTGTETYQGKTMTATAYATTVYVKRADKKWWGLFHQESMIPPNTASADSR